MTRHARTDSESALCQTPDARRGRGAALALAGLIVAADLVALLFELTASLAKSFGLHRGLAEALFLHLRYFTILTNWGVTLLMLATLIQIALGRRLPSPRFYGALAVYIFVVCVTYELMLRASWSPQGFTKVSDTILHDVVPVLTLAFWILFAPKAGLAIRDAALWLLMPLAYLVITLVAGAFGQGYPYHFIDADKIGYIGLATNAVGFLAAFFGVGCGAVWLARTLPLGIDSKRS